ncbi:unnamed protein product [Cuscuta campestris]|uniref:Retrotransposon gag domain-containing protein n=1 Tax=Cuscuta campestris TaxID=132261 RepID=A0A484N818_9ASTE|nr:unnamed protein product [Cuscuta campestris]
MSQAAGNDGQAVPEGEPEHVSVHTEASSFTPQQASEQAVPGADPIPEAVPIIHWATFDRLFHEEYIPEHFVEAKREEFLKFTQGELTLPEYRQKFGELAGFGQDLVPTVEKRCKRFMEGLRAGGVSSTIPSSSTLEGGDQQQEVLCSAEQLSQEQEGMDWLTANQAVVDCEAHTVRLRAEDGSDVLIHGELLPKAPEFISYIHARRLIRKKCEAFLCTVRDTCQEAPSRGDIPTLIQSHYENLTYEEEPVEILAREVRQLRNKTIPLVKVLWRSHTVEEATWVTEESMRARYPHLFSDQIHSSAYAERVVVFATRR